MKFSSSKGQVMSLRVLAGIIILFLTFLVLAWYYGAGGKETIFALIDSGYSFV